MPQAESEGKYACDQLKLQTDLTLAGGLAATWLELRPSSRRVWKTALRGPRVYPRVRKLA